MSLGIRDAEVCLTCHTRLDEPEDWPEDGPEWLYPEVQVAWPCVAYLEVQRLSDKVDELEDALTRAGGGNRR